MQKIVDIFRQKSRTFSFEIFPPKTEKGLLSLDITLNELRALPFDFVSVTYGAGGSSRDTTCGLVRKVQDELGLVAVHHFTCVCHSRHEIRRILDDLKSFGVHNLLALRGDPPKDSPDWQPGPENFQYSSDLVSFIREYYGDYFSLGVAGFPEGHPLAKDKESDAEILKAKITAGGDFVMTQLFFDNALYFDYVKRLRSRGINKRIIPGILPITSYEGVVSFCKGCGATVPQQVHDVFAPLAGDKERTLDAGTRFAIAQCKDLLAGGAPGLHFYTLNKTEPVRSILAGLGQDILKAG